MLYLSQLLGAPVTDQHNVHLGKITDVLTLASQVGRNEATYPTVILIAGEEDQHWQVPYSAIEKHGHIWRLHSPSEQFVIPPQLSLQESSLQEEVSLVREVLDKQVIDLQHKKAIRVNDVCFDDDWRILGIDNSTLGLLRHLVPARLLGTKSKSVPSTLVPWSQVKLHCLTASH